MAIDTTGAQATPNEETRASDLMNLSDDALIQEFGLDDLAAGAGAQAQAEEPEVEAEEEAPAGDEPEGESGSEAEAPDDGGSGEEEEGEAEGGESEGEGGEAEPPLAAEFAVFQGDDEVEIPRDVMIKFRADGQERELPLDRVVKLAQVGYYNEERAQEIREFREQLPQIEETFNGLQTENQALREGLQRILSGDEDYLEAEREEFARAQSPEARAQRLERELQEVRRGQSVSREEQAALQFVQNLAPEFEAIAKASPEVSFEEVLGRFNILTAPLMVRGQIPPAKFREVDRIVRHELRQWADAQNTSRASQKKAQTQTVERTRAQALAAKRQTARAVMPRGTQPGSATEQKPPRKYESASDINDDVADIVAQSLKTR